METQSGSSTSVYLRTEIIEKVDEIVAENRAFYISRSQLINSLLYKFLRERKKVPAVEEQTP